MTFIDYIAAWTLHRRATERGASLIEYALLIALLAVVCIGAVTFLGGQTADGYSQIGASLN